MTAIGAINELSKQGLKCPDDVSIAGYDGMLLGKYMSPSLTTIRQDTDKIGKLASAIILKFIEKKGDIVKKDLSVDGSIIVGKSVAKIRG